MTAAVDVAVPALLIVVMWLLPAVNRRTVQFGVRVPPSHASDPVLGAQRRAYHWTVGAGGVLILVVGAALGAVTRQAFVVPLVVLGVLAVAIGAYLRARHGLLEVKTSDQWYSGLRQAVVTDTDLRTRPERFPWLWALPAILVLVVTVVIGIVLYPSMPARLVTHYNAGGHVDRTTAKSIGSAFLLVYMQLFVTVLIVGLLLASFRARPALDASSPRASSAAHRRSLQAFGRALLVLAACVNLTMLLISWATWHGQPLNPLAVVVPLVAGVAGTVAVFIGAARRPLPDEHTGVVQRDDDALWRGGLLYINREDPAFLVPKRFGGGWTFNFGNPMAIVIFVVIIAAAVVLPLVVAASSS